MTTRPHAPSEPTEVPEAGASACPPPDYLVDYADDPTSILVPGHPDHETLCTALSSLDLNDPDFGALLDGPAMAAGAKQVWMRPGTEAEFDENGPPDPDGVLEPGMDYWVPCVASHRASEPWTRMDVEWA